MNEMLLMCCERAIGGTKQCRSRADGAGYRVLGSFDLAPYAVIRHFCQVRVRPAVVSYLVAFTRGPLYDFWVLGDIFTDDEERDVNVVLCE